MPHTCPVPGTVGSKLGGVIHSLAALALVFIGRYALIETAMKFFIALMFIVVLICAAWVAPEIPVNSLVPGIPEGSTLFIFGVIGGVGGSVTLLCYGYWIRERGWNRAEDLARTREDLSVAYILTGLFAIAIMVIAAGVKPEVATGPDMALGIASQLETVAGPAGKWFFPVGFWGAVFSSMLGVWQGVPYLFEDFVQQYTWRPYWCSPCCSTTRSSEYSPERPGYNSHLVAIRQEKLAPRRKDARKDSIFEISVYSVSSVAEIFLFFFTPLREKLQHL